MITDHDARAYTARWEGLRLTPYICPAGAWSIGYGHNLEALPLEGLEDWFDAPFVVIGGAGKTGEGKTVRGPSRVSTAEAVRLLDRDRALLRYELVKARPWTMALGPATQLVLADLAYNMGVPALLGFRRMMGFLETLSAGGATSLVRNSAAAELRDSDYYDRNRKDPWTPPDISERAWTNARILETTEIPPWLEVKARR